jgi:hypothetical protein
MDAKPISHRRQVLYWRLLTSMFDFTEQGANFETMSAEIVDELGLPQLILDPNISIEQLLQRYPELEADFTQATVPTSSEADALNSEITLRRALVFSKLLLNTFGPNTQSNVVTAEQYAQWLKDIGYLEQALGYCPGGLRGKQSGGGQGQSSGAGGQGLKSTPGGREGGSGTGEGFIISEEQLRATLQALEGELIDRMALREVLKDDQLAAKLTLQSLQSSA